MDQKKIGAFIAQCRKEKSLTQIQMCIRDSKYATRKGGYTRIVKIGQRKGDAAMTVVLELV